MSSRAMLNLLIVKHACLPNAPTISRALVPKLNGQFLSTIAGVRTRQPLRSCTGARLGAEGKNQRFIREHSFLSRSFSTQPSGLAKNAKIKVPSSSWCSHMHIVGHTSDYPLSPSAAYAPEHPHILSDARKFLSSHGTPRMVLVQPSIYGTDNSCLLDGLRELGLDYGRGVVEIDPRQPPNEPVLNEWHDLGVRGVRLNIKSISDKILSEQELATVLAPHAKLCASMKWVLDLHLSLQTMPALKAVIEHRDVFPKSSIICIDHFGGPSFPAPASHAEDDITSPTSSGPDSAWWKDNEASYTALRSMLLHQKVRMYIKFSAIYRLCRASDLEAQASAVRWMALDILKIAPDRVVYATDWPHTRFGTENVDAEGFKQVLVEWCRYLDGGDQGSLVNKVFKENADRLWA